MSYLLLFFEFFKTGLFAVGGGMATLPFLFDMAAKYPDWFNVSQLTDMVAVSESTPGPIGVNMASYVGFTVNGILGSAVATIGLVFPSVVIIILISRVLAKFRNNRYVDAAFYGLRPCSIGLIAAAWVLVVKTALLNTDLFSESGILTDLFDYKCLILAAVLIIVTRFVKATKKLHPVFFILFSAACGILFSL